ncbi:AAA family ATPase [Candidatus Woesearchaeota archaeon]|nr:AAA family ATPase [Candidatus Woesearchaeota archaeon]
MKKRNLKKKKQDSKLNKKSKKNLAFKRISTGIVGLDNLVQGGFVDGSTNLVSGGPGSGKTIFALQFLLKGIEVGENGVYVSFEETKENFYKYMSKFGWNLMDLEKAKKFIFLRYSPEQVKALLQEGGGEIERAMQGIKAKRLVIDSINGFTLLFPNELAGREALLELFSLISKYGCTTLLTLEQEAEPDKRKASFVDFEVDSVMILLNTTKGNVRRRVFEIIKMRGTKFEEKIIPFRIKDKGIVLYPEENVI